jgi:hypothetical protein
LKLWKDNIQKLQILIKENKNIGEKKTTKDFTEETNKMVSEIPKPPN